MVAHWRRLSRDFDRKLRRGARPARLSSWGSKKKEAPRTRGFLELSRRLARYLHWAGTYFASTLPAVTPTAPAVSAVAVPAEVQAQSMLPWRPVARGCPPM